MKEFKHRCLLDASLTSTLVDMNALEPLYPDQN